MARSKTGGAFGFMRGRIGAVSYSIISAKRSASGKKEQGMREIPTEVANPQTVSQCLQRMKLGPAQKFYAAFVELLSNAFQNVDYGQKSRNYFLSKAMQEDGPYVQKSVDRFIPGQYLFSEGSIKSVGINPFSGGATVITLDVKSAEAQITPAVLATALGVTTDHQITIAVVNNKEGVFVPSYIGYDQRLKIADMPVAALGRDAEGYLTIDIAGMGLDASAVVAMCVVLSYQDVSGKWLRSTQTMVVSNELIASLYGTDAMEAAILSYQTDGTKAANSINSEWYYNLGMNQAFAGKLTTGYINIDTEAVPSGIDANAVIGLKQANGIITKTLFFTSLDENGVLVVYEDGYIRPAKPAGDFMMPIIKYTDYQNFADLNTAYNAELWNNVYATQMGLQTIGFIQSEQGLAIKLSDDSVVRVVSLVEKHIGDNILIVGVTSNNEECAIKCISSSLPIYDCWLKNMTGWGSAPSQTSSAWKLIESGAPTKFIPVSPDNDSADGFENAQTLVTLGLPWKVFLPEA